MLWKKKLTLRFEKVNFQSLYIEFWGDLSDFTGLWSALLPLDYPQFEAENGQ